MKHENLPLLHGNFRVIIISWKLCLYFSIRAFLFFLSRTLSRVWSDIDSFYLRTVYTSLRFSASFLSTLSFLLNETISLFIRLISSAYFFLNKTKKHSFIGQYKEQSIPLKIIKNKNVFQSYSKNSIFFIVCDLFHISYILFIFCKEKKKNFITRISLSRNFSPTDSLLLRISLLRNSFLVEKFSDNKILCNLKNFLGIK